MRQIRVDVEFSFPGVPSVEEYYDLPDGWDELDEAQQSAILADYAVEEINNAGVGSSATVVDVPEGGAR